MARPDETVVFFDVGGVLVDFDGLAAARRLTRAAGLGALRAARKLWTKSLIPRIERGELGIPDLHRQFCKHSGWDGTLEDFCRLWNSAFTLKRPSAELFARLAKERPVFLLSNTNSVHFEHLKSRYPFVKQASGAVLSYEVGARKPEPAIYKAAFKLAKAEPARCLLIDDRRTNVLAARRLGMKAITYRGARRLKKDLKRLGLL